MVGDGAKLKVELLTPRKSDRLVGTVITLTLMHHIILTPEEEQLSLRALEFIKSNKIQIIRRFASDERCPSVSNPISMFMAGSPGAGKTEFSKRMIEFMIQSGSAPITRIDSDEIRSFLPKEFDDKNAYIFKRAASKGVDFLHDHVLKKDKNFILDGTLSNYEFSRTNVERSLKKGRPVVIVYLYQDPVISWGFTRERELIEHRSIPKEAFIEELFAAKENVNKIKLEFGGKIILWLIERNLKEKKDFKQSLVNIDNVDNHISIRYTKTELIELLQ